MKLSFTPFSFIFHTTNAADSPVVVSLLKIFRYQWVASMAMRLSFIFCGQTLSTKYILSRRHGLKMLWVDTISYTTQMIYDKFFGNCTFEGLISDSVNSVQFSIYTDLPISILNVSTPKPTGFGFYRSFQYAIEFIHALVLPQKRGLCNG